MQLEEDACFTHYEEYCKAVFHNEFKWQHQQQHNIVGIGMGFAPK